MSANKIVSIQQGESLPFKFDRGGDSITNWTATITWKQFPDDTIDINALSATITAGGTGYIAGDDLTLAGGIGTTAVFNVDTVENTTIKITATTIAFVNSNPDTITDSGSGFVTAGFVANDVITVSGSTSNDGTFTISSVVAGTITLISADALTAETAGSSVTITSGVVTSVSVIENSEGSYASTPSNPASTTSSTGSGCTLTVAYDTGKTRVIATADDGTSWDGFLTNSETDELDIGLWWLTATLINLVTDELEQIPVRFNVTKKWA